MEIKSYEDLKVWQLAMDLVVECYRATDAFPKSEQFGLTGQIRRSAVSVPSNIAEGHSRQHRKEYVQFLSVASGSIAELETQLKIAARLAFLPVESSTELLKHAAAVGKMLHSLRRALEP